MKLQSAIEYLMTYGWAILIIAVILLLLFNLGVFTAKPGAGSCVANSGFLCGNPVLATNGLLTAKFGEFGQNIEITGIGCSNTTSAPSQFTSYSQSINSGETQNISFSCVLPSNVLGTVFSGTLWIQYNQGEETGLEQSFATAYMPSTYVGAPAPGPGPILLADYSTDPAGTDSAVGGLYGGPSGIVISNGNAYWLVSNTASNAYGWIEEVPLGGGTVTTLADDSTPGCGGIYECLNIPDTIAADSSDIYWSAFTGGMISKIPQTGGSVTILTNDNQNDDGVAVANGYVYYTTDDNPGNVIEVPIGGGANTVLASSQDSPTSIAADSSNVFWQDGHGDIQEVPVSGGANTILATSVSYENLVESNGYLYFASGTQILKMSVNGGSIIVLDAAAGYGTYSVSSLAVANGNVYWANKYDGSSTTDTGIINEVSINGGANTLLANAQDEPSSIAAGNNYIAWTDAASGNVMSLKV